MKIKPLVISLLPIVLAACDESSLTHQSIESRTVNISFKAAVGEEDYKCGQIYSDIGTDANDYQVKGLQMFVSNIQTKINTMDTVGYNLVEDGVWQHDGVALLDFGHGCDGISEPMTNTTLEADVSLAVNQNIEQICFDVGVPFELNHQKADLAAAPLNNGEMFWVWQAGYKFFRLDGISQPSNGSNNSVPFNMHLGSTGCQSEDRTEAPTIACASPNRPTICLDMNPQTQQVVLDIKALFSEQSISRNTPNTRDGCTSANNDPECKGIIPAFGLDFSYKPNSTDIELIPANTQLVTQLFRVENINE